MSSNPLYSLQSVAAAPDLLTRAVSVLAREVARLPPVAERATPESSRELPALQPVLASQNAARPAQSIDPSAAPSELIASALASTHGDKLRRRGSELLEALLFSLTQGAERTAGSPPDQVPLIRCASAVTAGSPGRASIRIAHDEATAVDVSLYASTFVSDSGYELPSLLVSITPRCASVPPGEQVVFELQIAVPAQTPAGDYSGLVQAAGCKYVKAVVMVEVR